MNCRSMNHERIAEVLTGKPRTVIWESEFSAAVASLYGRPYHLQQQRFYGQNTYVEFTVPAPVDEVDPKFEAWQQETPPAVEDWRETTRWEREHYPDLEDIVNDLHARGLLAAGDYALHIWW